MTTTHTDILLVDDDAAFRSVYATLLNAHGYKLDQANDRESCRAMVAHNAYAVVLLDLMLPPDGSAAGGIEQMKAILSLRPDAKVIIVSGAGDTPIMLQAVRAGAYDFITKPADPDVLLTVVQRAMQRFALEQQLVDLRASLAAARPEDAVIGESPSFRAALELAGRVAPTTLPVLLLGESGTGKEMFARLIHARSPRAARPFISVNCGAVPETLFESVLFGHRRGAFTGAVRDHAGLCEQANGGTLFLDEIGDLPPALQVKVLRALESGEIMPIGADRPSIVDLRVISATNHDLATAQRDGRFREDLYWRIRGTEIRLPPLRERVSDIPLLAAFFLNQVATLTVNARPKTLTAAAEEALAAHAWPGNLRELRHEMQRASVLVERASIDADDLTLTAPPATDATAGAPGGTLAEKLEAVERREIELTLRKHHGNRTHAAQELGLSRQGLLNKMTRYGFG